MMGWRVEMFTVPVAHDFPAEVAGWVKGCFGLDFRAVFQGDDAGCGVWAITHLPSGFSIGGLGCSREEAMEQVDRLAALTDWSMVEPKTARFFQRFFSDWAQGIARGRLWHTDALVAPWSTYAVPIAAVQGESA